MRNWTNQLLSKKTSFLKQFNEPTSSTSSAFISNIAYVPSFSLFQQIGVVSAEKENSFFKLELNEVIYTETTKKVIIQGVPNFGISNFEVSKFYNK